MILTKYCGSLTARPSLVNLPRKGLLELFFQKMVQKEENFH